jgi:membrane associated rhomboid family serine protease
VIPIPIGDENPTSRRPVVNQAVIALNGLVFLWFNVLRGEGFFELSRADSDAWGFLPGNPTALGVLTSMFLHAGPWHLLGNMWFLHIFGDNVEDKLGRGKYVVLYLAWGALATMAFLHFGKPAVDGAVAAKGVLQDWNARPLVGASGAISGVMGAYLVFFPRARIRMIMWILYIIPFTLPALVVIGMYFVKDLVLAVIAGTKVEGGGVAYAAHTGGMVAGIVAAFVFKPWLRKPGAASAWDRDTGFDGDGPAGAGGREPWEPPRTIPLPDLRDQIVGAVLDGRMDLALDLQRRRLLGPEGPPLPPAVELEIANEVLRRGRIQEAEEAYLRFLGAHPSGGDAAEAKFRIGLIHARALGDKAGARRWLAEAAAEHPDPRTAAFARSELERL